MACGLSIVASPMVLEGVPQARDRVHLRVATSPDEFARRVLELLGDGEARAALGARARALASEYDWGPLGDRVDAICREEVARRASVR
jgi:glycosyltransferase involved in cell wall biosynthesis